MDRVAFTRTMNKYGFEKISSQTVPGTFSEISHNSLLVEQVNNRASAQWKKAEFIFCSGINPSMISSIPKSLPLKSGTSCFCG